MANIRGVYGRGGLAGLMRETFTVSQYVQTEDAYGAGGTMTLTTVYTGVRGRLNDMSSEEREHNKRLEMDTTHELQIWARGVTLKPGYVFLLNGTSRMFELISVKLYENRSEVFNLTVKEFNAGARP